MQVPHWQFVVWARQFLLFVTTVLPDATIQRDIRHSEDGGGGVAGGGGGGAGGNASAEYGSGQLGSGEWEAEVSSNFSLSLDAPGGANYSSLVGGNSTDVFVGRPRPQAWIIYVSAAIGMLVLTLSWWLHVRTHPYRSEAHTPPKSPLPSARTPTPRRGSACDPGTATASRTLSSRSSSSRRS